MTLLEAAKALVHVYETEPGLPPYEWWDQLRAAIAEAERAPVGRDLAPAPDPLPQAGCSCLACEKLRDYQRRGLANAWRRDDAERARVEAVVQAAEGLRGKPLPASGYLDTIMAVVAVLNAIDDYRKGGA